MALRRQKWVRWIVSWLPHRLTIAIRTLLRLQHLLIAKVRHRWRRSLQLRVVGTTLVISAAVVAVLEELPTVIEHEDVDGARDLIKRARAAQQACLARLDDVVRSESETGVPHATGDTAPGRWDSSTQPVALALTYRHLGRIAANALNIASSVVVPLDRLDYPSTLE